MKITVSTILIFLALLICQNEVSAQEESKWKSLDKSPLDMAYYPANTAWRNYLSGEARTSSPKMRIVYSRPSKNGRDIFGSLVPFGSEWRLGANEATEITFYQAVEIDGQRIGRGVYTMFATPQKDHWTIQLSTQRSIWGAENRDQSLTVASFKIATETLSSSTEALSMAFQRVNDESANLVIEWDMTRVSLPIGFNPVNFEDMDASPMDQVHFPETSSYHNYLKADELTSANPKLKVTYSRPQKKGRKIFGELLEYGKVWRIGANESTEISMNQAITVAGKDLPWNTYNMYAVVNEKSWDIIFNTDRPAWGAANRDETKDALTVTVPVEMGTEDLENLNIKFEEKSAMSLDMIIAWEKTRVRIPITIKE